MTTPKSNIHYSNALQLENSGGDPQEILNLLELAANDGCADASYALGTFYLHGKYVSKDNQKTLDYFRDAADQMYPDALFDLGVALEKGEIVRKNLKEAFRCYVLAMVFGDNSAVFEVARCLYHGIGTKPNRELYKTLMIANDQITARARDSESPPFASNIPPTP